MIKNFIQVCIFFCVSCFLSASLAKKPPLLINGAGATFPYILYSKWFNEYSKVKTEARINYRSIGSGGGIRQFLRGTLDFGASDVPMSPSDLKNSKKKVVHIPTTLSAVVITYNLPGLSASLQLNSNVIAQIFNGSIKKWNDPQIMSLNPKQKLPDQDIVVVYRADGSGTTAVFTEYLALTQENWLNTIGKGKSVNWPVGVGGKGNEGVLALVRKIKGALGYLGMGYALNRNLPTARIQNKNNRFIQPSIASVQKAAEISMSKNKDYLHTIVNADGPDSYPLSSFTYLLIYQEMPEEKGGVILDFLTWALSKGQSFSLGLYYVPLPANVIQKTQSVLQQVRLVKSNADS